MLERKQQAFAVFVARLILKAGELGFTVSLGEAWRPQPMCDWYAAHGGGIRGSNHERRLAIDLNLFSRDGRYLPNADDYRPLGEWWKAQSTPEFTCCWGGDFKDEQGRPKPDMDHFSFLHEGTK